MQLLNATKMPAGYTLGRESDGRELLVVAIKGTFVIPGSGEVAKPAEKQAPLVEADVSTGEPGFSAPLYETDYAHRKPRCDVLLNGTAYAPGGKPTDRMTVSLNVGSLRKSFDVVGNRVWQAGALYIAASKPKPFTTMPISYNNAFGGVDRSQEDPLKHHYYPLNHAGVGYHEYTSGKYMDGKPLPNTEESGQRISNPKGKYRPMAFGPVGRAWQPRPKWAGTYDEAWLNDRCPFWPQDFDFQYFQASSPDQHCAYLRGGEQVLLKNLSPEGELAFKLPRISMPVLIVPHQGKDTATMAVIDTLVLEPDQRRFMLTWRASHPLRRNLFEIKEVVIGEKRRRNDDVRFKQRFPNLNAYIRWHRKFATP
jgi:hypothetical protein